MRTSWIDIAKGIGILLVVVGHNLGIWSNFKWLAETIYLFHMPLFFFITGCTALSAVDVRSRANRVFSLIWQYFLFSILLFPATIFFGTDASMGSLALGVIYGSGHTTTIVPLWFLTTLAVSLIIFYTISYILESHFSHISTATPLLLAIIFFGLGVTLLNSHFTAYVQIHDWGNYSQSGGIWNVDVALIAVAYIFLGATFSRLHNKLAFDHFLSITYIAAGILCLAYLHFIGVRLDLNYRRLSPPVGALLASFVGISLTILVAKYMDKFHHQLGLVFIYIGRSSLVILALHNGLQNRGFTYLFGIFNLPPNSAWLLGGCFGILTPMVIDHLLIRRSHILSRIFYPRFFTDKN